MGKVTFCLKAFILYLSKERKRKDLNLRTPLERLRGSNPLHYYYATLAFNGLEGN